MCVNVEKLHLSYRQLITIVSSRSQNETFMIETSHLPHAHIFIIFPSVDLHNSPTSIVKLSYLPCHSMPFISTNELRMKFSERNLFEDDVPIHFPTKCAISEDATAASTLMIMRLINDLYHLMTIVISKNSFSFPWVELDNICNNFSCV